jgi:hypothetical protein
MNVLAALPSFRSYAATPTATPSDPQPQTPSHTAPPAQQPTIPPGGSATPPPLAPGETSSAEKPSDPKPGKVVFLPTSTTTITRTYDEPVYHSEVLGRIPADYYQPAFNPSPWGGWGSVYYPIGSGTFGMGQVDVVRNVPDYNSDGSAKKQSVTKTLTATTYDQKKRTIGFGLAAAAAGAGAAALVGAARGAGIGPLGMLVGGALGAVAGAAIGYKSAVGDKISEQWMTDSIEHPSLIGYEQWMNPDYRTEYETHQVRQPDGSYRTETTSHQVLQGWWVRYSPEIRWKPVGSYTYPTLQHSAKIGPVGGSFMAVGAGALIGVGAALATTLL